MPSDRKPALPWKTAAAIAWREVRSSRTKFLFVLLSVAIGVAALTGVRAFSSAFRKTLLEQARSLMAADLSARMFQQADVQQMSQLRALARQGTVFTWVTETVSMAAAANDPVPLLVSLKAVAPSQYPFYGSVTLQPAIPLSEALTDSSVAVDDNLLVRLHASVGDSLKIGGRSYRIAALIAREPDRITAGVGLGPRVMMSRAALDETGLLQQGSRATERYLFRVGAGQSVAALRAQVEKILPEAQVADFRETSPALTEGLDRSTGLLSLICLVAMVLGAIGVAMAMRAHLQQRIEILAIMKSIGARSADILRIYLLQTVALGLAGGLLGVALGLGVEAVFPVLLAHLLPVHTRLGLAWQPVLAALGTGVLTTVLFCLPPLLQVRRIRPSVVLRKVVDGEPNILSWSERWVEWLAVAAIVAGLGGIAAALSDSAQVGRWFTASLCMVLLVSLGMAALLLRILRAALAGTRRRLPSALRHGLANLYRPGNQSAAVLAALAIGVMLILSVFLMQRSIVREMHASAPPSTPNLFLIDISSQELQPVRDLLGHLNGIEGKVETVPVVSGRLLSINGTPVENLKLRHYPRRMLRSVSLTWSQELPAGTKIVSGRWWSGDSAPELAVVDHLARRLHLSLGSQLAFEVGGKTVPVRVIAIYKVDGEHAFARSEFIVPQELLRGSPVVWYGAVHALPASIPSIERSLFSAFPGVTVINIADILQTIQSVVDQITTVLRFLAAFSILSGMLILASSIASTRFRRVREVVVLKTLGASRRRISVVFSIEFAVLGLAAGVIGVLFANLLARVLLHRMDVRFSHDWPHTCIAVAATAMLAILAGWAASFRILGQKPLEVLREE